MNKEYLKNRAGVSLIAVLMFMLVATIAATATWKFITSEGFSSASRMLKREAYQSAQAGIENARSWMTFHANDVGALIKQFQDNNSQPINLDDQLRTLQRAGQNYHVWLTGVNTDKSTYKLKILAFGEARNNTRHTEVAIFNVDGLFQVRIPANQTSSSFAEAFHGDLKTASEINVDRAVITQTPDVKNGGGQALNKIIVTDYLIMDGSFYANNKNSIKDLYVTGDVGTCSGINVTNNLYVGGTFYPGNDKSTIGGSLYTEGGINLKNTYPYTSITGGCGSSTIGSAEIGGNITSNGPFIYYDANGSNSFVAQSSMVLNSKIDFPTTWTNSEVKDRIEIKHNVYVKEGSSGYLGYVSCNQSDEKKGKNAIWRTKFGSNSEDKIWMYGFVHYQNGPTANNYLCASNTSTTNCEKDGYACARSGGYKKWIGYKGTFLDTEPSADEMASWNADRMTKYIEKVEEKSDCGTAKTPIQINKKIFDLGLTHSKNSPKGCSPSIWKNWENKTSLMNECYSTAKANGNLYNNDWLIMEFDDQTGWSRNDMKGELNGNFILKFTTHNASYQLLLPATSGNSKVFLYLPNGWDAAPNSNIEFAETSGKQHRYFVFSEDDITRFDMLGLDPPMSGSVVMAKCAQFNTQGNNVALNVYFDQQMTDDLTEASIICDNDGSDQCSTIATSSSSGASSASSDDDTIDRYYISMAPQLGVSLESQNKSFENVEALQGSNGSTNLATSFIILPRVISLPSDPYGSLKDYINVITLNKPQTTAALTKNDLSLSNSCTKINGATVLNISSLSSKLYDPDGSKLQKGTYKCLIKANGYNNTVPVYVVIDNQEMRKQHRISFAEASQNIGSTGSKDIYVRLQPQIPSVNLNVSCPNPPSSWKYSEVLDNVSTGETCTFTVSNLGKTEKLIKLFTIETTGATSGSMNFQILEGENYISGELSTSSLYISTTASLYRESATLEQINTYCSTHEDACPTENERYNWQNCDEASSEKWVEPDGVGFQTATTNDSWLITTAGNTAVKLKDVSSGNCTIIIPEDETCTFTDSQNDCTLHASAKAKVNKIKFKFKNVETGKVPSFTIAAGTQTTTCNYNDTEAHECLVSVYGGDLVSAYIETSNSDNEDFNYWQCEGASCPPNLGKLSSNTFPSFNLSDNATVITLSFNEIDKHCFFDTFKNSAAACRDLRLDEKKEYCIDYCYPAERCESAITSTSYIDSKWHLVKGKMNMVDYSNGKISVVKNGDITVMSTINADAGTHGTLKALARLAKGNAQSGFLLGSNANASRYLILSIFIDNTGFVNAKLCNESSLICDQKTFTTSATEDDMIMIEAGITAENITVSVTKDSENTKASVSFDLGAWSENYQGSYVGFRIASPKFKLYGIGWKSTNYECFNTYPTIKCSFAAVAQNGVIPREKYVKPWVGYSGWEGWNKNSCTEMYYYKGTDACSGDNYGYTTCSSNGYYFSATSNGKHGYTDENGIDIKTAKVGLDCQSSYSSSTEESMWANDSAHCGVFWTGTQNSCTTVEKINNEMTLYGASSHQSAVFNRTVNLRGAQIRIEAENPDGSEVQVRLNSEGQGDELYSSEFVTFTDNSKIFDINEFTTEASGFDPGKVKSIYFENKGNGTVTITNISTICNTAVRVKSCKIEEKHKTPSLPSWWPWVNTQKYIEVTATVNNRSNVEQYRIIAQKKKETSKYYELDPNKVIKSGEENATIYLHKGVGDIEGILNDWSFYATVKTDGADYSDTVACNKAGDIKTPVCTIEQPGPDDNKEFALGIIEFHAKLEHCEGCSYAVTLNNIEQSSGNCEGVGKCDVRIDKNKFTSLTAGNTYTFKFYSPDNEFNACERTFKVKEEEQGTVHLNQCTVQSVNGSSVTLTTQATGCPGENDCSYTITPSANETGKYKDNKTIIFSYAGEGPVSHILTVQKGNEQKTCSFTATYETASSSSVASSSSANTEITSITCPDNKTNQDPAAAISLQNYSASPCGTGCTYKVFDGSTEKNFSGGSFNDPNGTGTKTYTFEATNSYGKKDSCEFTVTFKTGSSSCGCTCHDCSNIITGTNVGVNRTSNNSTICVFGSQITFFNPNNQSIIINGTTVSTYCDGWSGTQNPCQSIYGSIGKIDGGYYMEIPQSSWIHATVSGATSNPCNGSGGNGGNEESSSSGGSTSTDDKIIGDYDLSSGNYPDKAWVPSGTCFTIRGTWTNQYYYASPKMQCNGSEIKITYKGSEIGSTVGTTNGTCTSNALGKFTYQTSTTVFFEHICVTSKSGNNIECGLTN